MGGAFGGQVCGEFRWIRDAGEMCAFEDVLVVGFGGEEERGGVFRYGSAAGEERFHAR